MNKIVVVALFFSILMFSCQKSKEPVSLEKFSNEYIALQQKFQNLMKQAHSGKDYAEQIQQKNKQLERLLKKSNQVPFSDRREIIKSKILIHLSKLKDAEKIINPLLDKKTNFQNDAKMVKIQIFLSIGKIDEALELFKEIESQVSRNKDFFSICLFFAIKAKDIKISAEYTNKLLEASDLPAEFTVYKSRLYSVLAAAAYREGQIDKSKLLLRNALEMTSHPLEKKIFESHLSQLELIGKPAPLINAESWINSPPLQLQNLKGKNIMLDFWAPWCAPCRESIPELIRLYKNYRNKNWIIIGYTKLYGMYSDELESKGKVNKADEIKLLRNFVKRYAIPYPVAISQEGEDYAKYHITGIPTMVFINAEGVVQYVQIGQAQPGMVEEKIKELTEK